MVKLGSIDSLETELKIIDTAQLLPNLISNQVKPRGSAETQNFNVKNIKSRHMVLPGPCAKVE